MSINISDDHIDYLMKAEYWLCRNVGLGRFNRQSLVLEIDKHFKGGWSEFTQGHEYLG